MKAFSGQLKLLKAKMQITLRQKWKPDFPVISVVLLQVNCSTLHLSAA